MAAPLSYGRFHHKIIKTGRKEVNELELIQTQLAGLLHQQDIICEYLEKGI